MPLTLSEQYAEEQQKKDRELRLKIASDADYDPEHASRVFHVSAVTNLPSQVVAQDLPGLESKLKREAFDYKTYTDEETGSPIFNEFAAEDPYNFAVLDRDRKHMNAIEKTIHSIGLGGRAGWGTIELQAIANRKIAGTSMTGDEDLAKKLGSLMQGEYFGADNALTKALVMTAQQVPIQAWLVGQSLDEMALGALTYGSVAAIAGVAGPQAAFPEELFTYPVAIGMGLRHGFFAGRVEASFRLERGLAYAEFSELGFDPDDALLFANGVGGINAALESFGLGMLTKNLPGFRSFQQNLTKKAITDIFSKPTLRHAITRFTLQYGQALGTEVVTEVMQESTLYWAREHMKATARDAGDMRPELDPALPGEFGDMIADIAAKTLYGTVFLGAMGPISSFRVDNKRARAAQEQAAMWASLGDNVEASTTKDDSPSAWTEFVKRIKEKGPLQDVRFDIDGWKNYWQSKNVDPAEVAAEMGFNIDEMEVTDTDIVIPFDTYLEKLAGTEHHAGLINDFRARHDEMTLRESEQWFKTRDEKVKEFEETIAKGADRTAYDEIVEDLTGQLIAGGKYTPDAAATMAKLNAEIFVTMGKEGGVDPVQLYKQQLKGVYTDMPAALQVEDIDMDFDPLIDRIREGDFPKMRDIYGASLFDIIRKGGGIQDQGGEMSARDVQKQLPGMISKTGMTIDEAAELAFDQGYIAAHDSELLMEAFDRELGGEQVFGREYVVNTQLEELLGQLETAAQFLDEQEIDLNEMSNAQVREYLKGVKTLEQAGESDLKALTDMVMVMALREETTDLDKPYRSANRFDAVLGKIQASLPLVAEEQDFQDVIFTDKFIDSNGKSGTAKVSAQKTYEKAVKQRNLLKRLMDCVNG